MLQIFKIQAVTDVAKEQADIRSLEIDWYQSNFSNLSIQSALFAGLSFDQLNSAIPPGCSTGNMRVPVVARRLAASGRQALSGASRYVDACGGALASFHRVAGSST